MTEQKIEVRNILLIGRTGNGKSTLGNVLVNKNEEYEEVFKTSGLSTSETKNAQVEEFETNITTDGSQKIRYRIIDTIGIGDTKLEQKEVLRRIAQVVRLAEGGINQVLFVIKDRFTKEEIDAYNLLRTVVFDEKIVQFTAIVRTNFHTFRKIDVIEKDKSLMKDSNQGEAMAEIANSVRKIIHVNNPPTDTGNAYLDEGAKHDREKSREILLTYLHNCEETYNPQSYEAISEKISQHMTEQEIKEKEMNDLKELLESEKELSKKDREENERKILEIQQQQKRASEEFYAKLNEQMKINAQQMKETSEKQRQFEERLFQQKEKEKEEERKLAIEKEKLETLTKKLKDLRASNETKEDELEEKEDELEDLRDEVEEKENEIKEWKKAYEKWKKEASNKEKQLAQIEAEKCIIL